MALVQGYAMVCHRLALVNDQSFNDTLTNGIITFEQLGPVLQHTVDSCYLDLAYLE